MNSCTQKDSFRRDEDSIFRYDSRSCLEVIHAKVVWFYTRQSLRISLNLHLVELPNSGQYSGTLCVRVRCCRSLEYIDSVVSLYEASERRAEVTPPGRPSSA
jgi:hypothetical protein